MKKNERVREKIATANDEITRKADHTEYIGKVGDRLELTLTLVHVAAFETNYTYYGETNFVYTFKDDNGNALVWKTSKCLGEEVGKAITIKGTIKDHSEYRGVKQTVLTRCKIA